MYSITLKGPKGFYGVLRVSYGVPKGSLVVLRNPKVSREIGSLAILRGPKG